MQRCSSSRLHSHVGSHDLRTQHVPVLSLVQAVGSNGIRRLQHRQLPVCWGGWDALQKLSCSGISTNAHRTAVSVQQRQGHTPEPTLHAHSHNHHHSREEQADDGSAKIIMLLALSLTLLLLPWVSRHPEFLIAPVVLAVTPVVGNGVRPVLKEVAAAVLAAVRLVGSWALWHEQHPQQLHSSHHHNHHQNHHHGHRAANSNHRQRAGSPKHLNQQHHHQQQHQPPAMGPYSPWPNPARMPSNWEQRAASPAAAMGGQSSYPIPAAAAAADVSDAMDWTATAPPDPHQSDPASMQHLQQVLAADLQAEAELSEAAAVDVLAAAAAVDAAQVFGSNSSGRSSSPGRRPAAPAAAAAAGRSSSPAGSPRSPSGSPAQSMDLEGPHQQQQQQRGLHQHAPGAATAAAGVEHMLDQQQPHSPHTSHPSHHSSHGHVRDPRVLSREAKQQLYQHHHHHNHLANNSSSTSSSSSGNGS